MTWPILRRLPPEDLGLRGRNLRPQTEALCEERGGVAEMARLVEVLAIRKARISSLP